MTNKNISIKKTDVNWKECEIKSSLKLLEMGYNIYKPQFDDGVDFLAEKDGKYYKVQVKSKSIISDSAEFIEIKTVRKGNKIKRPYSKTEVDFFLIYDGINFYKVDNTEQKQIFLRYSTKKKYPDNTIYFAVDYIV